ncbi:MAG: DUF3732 domain-containing protein [Methanomicrobium sp.]|nr:DUF3732 domain-containing protein [Methanomicrobium sp.]
MSFQIKNVIIYGTNGEIRNIAFKTDSVNIITGASDTGKSALIPIINYCLGSQKCNVPLKYDILKRISWFGILLIKGEEELFIARRNPSNRDTSEDIYFEKENQIDLPNYKSLTKNTNLKGLIAVLNDFTGIGDYSFEPPENFSREAGTAKIPKALIYCFQKQNEVANPDILFHRQSEPFLAQSIKDYIPYFLGAVNEDTVLNKIKLRKLKRQLSILEKKKEEELSIVGNNFEKAESLIAEAKSVGIIPSNQQISDSWDQIKEIMVSAINSDDNQINIESSSNQELSDLYDQQKKLMLEHSSISDEINFLSELKNNENCFIQEANEHKSRLKSINLIKTNENLTIDRCPLCSSILENSIPSVESINSNLVNISNKIEKVSDDQTHLNKVITKAESKKSCINLDLRNVNSIIKSIINNNKKMQDMQDSSAKKAYIVGKLDLYLESLDNLNINESSQKEIDDLKNEIIEIENITDNDNIEDKMESILSIISTYMTNMVKERGLEYSKYRHRLDPKKLTVIADTEEGPVLMKKMGCGETWLSLHIITYLALHQWFAKKELPVPKFIFFDQITQVFYPSETKDTYIKNDDNEKVSNIFKFVINHANSAGIQVIITEHADISDKWYQDSIVENWWQDENKLIPISWINH